MESGAIYSANVSSAIKIASKLFWIVTNEGVQMMQRLHYIQLVFGYQHTDSRAQNIFTFYAREVLM